MTLRVSESVPDCWEDDDELDVLLKQSVVVFGEDATDNAVVSVIEQHCGDIDIEIDIDDGVSMSSALVPVIADAIKAEFRRLLTPH
jgi:hypothetical protein